MVACLWGPGVWTADAAVGVFPSLGSAGTNQITINNFAVNQQFVTNLSVNVAYVTNEYVSVSQVDISYVTNQYVSVSIVTNQYVTTNFINTSFVTNFYSSTSFITNLNVNKLTVNNFTTMNTFFTTNAFPSATNTFDLTNTFQLLQTFTSCSVTDLGSVSNNLVGQGFLIVSNASATGITMTVTIPFSTPVGQQTKSVLTIASGQQAWLKMLTYGNVFTNYADDVFPGTLAALGTAVYFTGVTNSSLAGSQFKVTDANKGEQTTLDGLSLTNLTYRYTTNAVPALTLTYGKSYFTNVSTANITLAAINARDLAATETCILRCTNSSGSDWTVTLPNGIGGPGLGTPPVITVTNKQACRIYIEHYGNQETNAWFIPRF